jgi:SulP family sulfate permease
MSAGALERVGGVLGLPDGYGRPGLRADVIAGLSLVVVLIPQAMAFSALVGVPPVAGLYSALVSLLVYALLGSSSGLSFGPIAIVSLLSGAAVAPLAGGDVERALALVALLAVMVGGLHIVLGLLRAGAIVDVISYPVLLGFTAGVGLTIATSQLRDLLGIVASGSDIFVEAIAIVVPLLGDLHPLTAAIGVTSLVLLLVSRAVRPGFPMVLTLAVLAVVASASFGLESRGVRIVGDIPSGFPMPSVPSVGLADAQALAGSALAIAVVGYAQTIAVGKAIAARSRQRIDAAREFRASGVANLASGLFGGFPTAGSLSLSSVLGSAGARSRVALGVAALALSLVLLLLTPVLEPLPRVILAALIMASVVSFIDVGGFLELLRIDRMEGAIAIVTLVASLTVGALPGLALGLGANLAVHLVRRMRPDIVELGRVVGTVVYRNRTRYPSVVADDGAIVRVEGSIDFLDASAVGTQLRRLVAGRPELHWIVLDASGVTEMDATGLRMLSDLADGFAAAGVELRLVSLRGPLRDAVVRAGAREVLLDRCYRSSLAEALESVGIEGSHPLRAPAHDERAPDGLH